MLPPPDALSKEAEASHLTDRSMEWSCAAIMFTTWCSCYFRALLIGDHPCQSSMCNSAVFNARRSGE
uniref:Uncharacterized protein n=1 Tax=Trichuris muris TaxID=70415 RepID=A0A5S6QWW1_TRIMR